MALDRIHKEPTCRSPELEAAMQESVEILAEQKTLPLYTANIESSKTLLAEGIISTYGTFWERKVVMDDGAVHHEYIGISNDPQADKLVVSVPAWWTSPRRGFNKETADKLMKAGYHVMIKGITENALAPLSRGAYDMHVSLNHKHNEGFRHNFSTRSVLLHGDSNGAMQGTGILDYAPQFGRIIERAYLVDPCLVHRPGISDIEKAFHHPTYLPKEIICIARQAIRMIADPEERAANHLGTIDPSIGYFIGNILLSKALFSGEFGMLARNLPEGQSAHFLVFNHSLANHKRELESILSAGKHETITYETRTGTHMSIANPRTVKDKVVYLTREPDPAPPYLRLFTT